MARNWILRFRTVDRARFEEIRSGRKGVETRAATKKYEPITEGDTLTFVCGKVKLKKKVAKKLHFASARAMVKKIPLKRIMPDVTSVKEMNARYETYPRYVEKIKEHGLFAFVLD